MSTIVSHINSGRRGGGFWDNLGNTALSYLADAIQRGNAANMERKKSAFGGELSKLVAANMGSPGSPGQQIYEPAPDPSDMNYDALVSGQMRTPATPAQPMNMQAILSGYGDLSGSPRFGMVPMAEKQAMLDKMLADNRREAALADDNIDLQNGLKYMIGGVMPKEGLAALIDDMKIGETRRQWENPHSVLSSTDTGGRINVGSFNPGDGTLTPIQEYVKTNSPDDVLKYKTLLEQERIQQAGANGRTAVNIAAGNSRAERALAAKGNGRQYLDPLTAARLKDLEMQEIELSKLIAASDGADDGTLQVKRERIRAKKDAILYPGAAREGKARRAPTEGETAGVPKAFINSVIANGGTEADAQKLWADGKRSEE